MSHFGAAILAAESAEASGGTRGSGSARHGRPPPPCANAHCVPILLPAKPPIAPSNAMPSIVQNHHVLAVHDLRACARFFVDYLGFRIVNEPPGWIFVQKDRCMIMMGDCRDALHPTALGDHNYFGYLVVDDADAYYAEIRARGHEPASAPVDKPWGMREFPLRTPEGHRLMVGEIVSG